MSVPRWFRALLRLFPADDRGCRAEEIADAFDADTHAGRWRESASMVWAAGVAWRRYLKSPAGLRQALWSGAVLWFAYLFAVGPVLRARAHFTDSLWGHVAGPVSFLIAVGAMTVGLAALVASPRRIAQALAAGLLGGGVFAAAWSNRVGDWLLLDSLLYELRWLGLAVVLLVVVKPRRPWRWPIMALVGAAGLALTAPLDIYQLNSSHNYAFATYIVEGSVGLTTGSNDWVVVPATVLLFVLPFRVPAVAALLTTPICGLILAGAVRGNATHAIPQLGLLAGYLTLVWLWNYRRPRLRIEWTRQ